MMLRNAVLVLLAIAGARAAEDPVVWTYSAEPGGAECQIVKSDRELMKALLGKGVSRQSMAKFPDIHFSQGQIAAVALRPRKSAAVPSAGFVTYGQNATTLRFISNPNADDSFVAVVTPLDAFKAGTSCSVASGYPTMQKLQRMDRVITRTNK